MDHVGVIVLCREEVNAINVIVEIQTLVAINLHIPIVCFDRITNEPTQGGYSTSGCSGRVLFTDS